MTNETIAPAMTRDEWQECEFEARYCTHDTSLQIDYKGRVFAESHPRETPNESDIVVLNEAVDAPTVLPKIIALANHALPDGHPLKIGKLDALLVADVAKLLVRDYGETSATRHLESLAAKLAALLPPDADL